MQNFVSAAVGIAVAIALVRGFARSRTDQLGNFWVDLVRTCFRILLPLSIVAAIVLIAGGAIENFHHLHTVHTIAGGQQSITGGPVASQEAIKELGTNGGGFYNANSAHPFENPTAWTNWFQIYLLLRHRLRAATHVRPDGRRQAAGPRDRRGHGGAVHRQRRSASTSSRTSTTAPCPTAVGVVDGGHRATVRRPGLGDLRVRRRR